MAQVILNNITAIQGETFDTLALTLYGNEKYAADLMMANPGLCHKMIFSGGEVLKVPELTETSDSPLPPWKQSA